MDHLKKIADDVDDTVVRTGLAGLRAIAAGAYSANKVLRTQYVYKNPQNEFTVVQVTDMVSFMDIPEREFYRIDVYGLKFSSALSDTPNMAEMSWICRELTHDYPDAKVYPNVPDADDGVPAGTFMVNIVFTEKVDMPNVA